MERRVVIQSAWARLPHLHSDPGRAVRRTLAASPFLVAVFTSFLLFVLTYKGAREGSLKEYFISTALFATCLLVFVEVTARCRAAELPEGSVVSSIVDWEHVDTLCFIQRPSIGSFVEINFVGIP